MESDEGDYHGSDDIDIPFSTLADIVGEDLKVAEEMRNARTLCEMSDSNIVDEELSKKTTDSFTDPLSESELLKDIEEITVNEDGEEISTVEKESSGVEPNISTSVYSPVASGSGLPVPSKNDSSTMIFYNRCRLLVHVRNHSDQGKEPILDSSAISFSILKPEDLGTLAKNASPSAAPNVDNFSSVPTPPEEEQTNPHTTNSKDSSSSQVPSSDLQAQAPGQDVEELPHNSLSERLGTQIQNTLEKPPCDKHNNPSRISVKVLNPSDTVEYVQTVESSEGEPSKNTELKICSECKSEVADLRLHFLATNKPLNSTIRCKHCDLQGFGTSVALSRVNDFPKSLNKRIGDAEKPVVEGLRQLPEVVLDGRHLQVPFSELFRLSTICVLTTKCSLSAHERTHTQSKPFICPECGRNYTFFSQLSVHLHYNCFHKAKCVRSMCSVCNMLFILPSSFEEHITRHHVKTVYKCEKCQVACLSINELRVHMANAHKGLFEKQTYKLCTLCPDKLISVPNIATHIKRHAFGRQWLIYVYQCSTCKRVFHSKTVLSTHIDVCKRQMAQLKQNKLKMAQQYVAIKNPLVSRFNGISPNLVRLPIQSNKSFKVLNILDAARKSVFQSTILPKSLLKPTVQIIPSIVREQTILPKTMLNASVNVTPSTAPSTCNTPMKTKETFESKIIMNVSPEVSLNTESTPTTTTEETDESQVFFPALSNESEILEKDPLSLDDVSGTENPSSFVKQENNVCENCGQEFNPSGDITELPLRCAACTSTALHKDLDDSTTQKKPLNGSVLSTFIKSPTTASNNPRNKLWRVKPLQGPQKVGCSVCHESVELHLFTKHFAQYHSLYPNKPVKVIKRNKNRAFKSNPSIESKHSKGEETQFAKDETLSKNHTRTNMLSQTLDKDVQISTVLSQNVELAKQHVKTNKIDQTPKKDVKIFSQVSSQNVELEKQHETAQVNVQKSEKGRKITITKRRREWAPERPTKARKKNTPKLKPEITPFTSGINVKADSVKESSSKLICSVCNFLCEDVTKFRGHILDHRTQYSQSSHQCMECGKCFVAKSSFKNHLFLEHTIRDFDSYVAEIDCIIPELSSDDMSDDELDTSQSESDTDINVESENLQENKCRVCKEMFDSDLELKQHFRTHGMAFLRMTRQGKK
uniref:C2H2-type domain-containing protein n=1 Tax=Timema tahoe TaxID=61484 RepID=A0A7R9FGM6_9NEOP|nr:unnamed protein product [Timema tahoe]